MSKGKIALVTGSNRGIGKEIVRQLAAKGCRVVLTARDPKAGTQAASAIKGEVEFLALDVTDDDSIAPLRKARTRLSGWQPMHLICYPESFSANAAKFLGETEEQTFTEDHKGHKDRQTAN
jgi:NAD(P)-dependent dehydrogenase (short-subunit alcohol dehydrogenase family)